LEDFSSGEEKFEQWRYNKPIQIQTSTRAVHYELLFCFAGIPNFLQKNKKEVTLLSSHGYKGQEQTTKFKY
jgi:hypothetical protein